MKLNLFTARSTEKGSTLMVTIAVTALLGAALATYLTMVTNQNQMVMRSQIWNRCMPILEAGIEEALTHCERNYQTNMVSNGWTLYSGAYIKSNAIIDGYYLVAISQTVPYQIVSSGYSPMPGSSTLVSRKVRVTTAPLGVFSGSLIVRNTIDLNGNNVRTDSFDSADPTKSTAGLYDPAKAGDKGDIGCVGGLVDIVDVGNADVWGHVLTGPLGQVRVGSNGAVGSKAWNQGGNKGVQTGWWQNDMNINFPAVELPFVSAAPPVAGDYNGETYDYLLSDGNYELGSLAGNVVVTGDVSLYVTGDVDFGGDDKLVVAPGANLKLYVAGAKAHISSVVNETGLAESFTYFGLPSNQQVIMGGGGKMVGSIYAPHASITMNGGVDFYGSVVGLDATLTGHSAFHYDEALGRVGPRRAFAIASWNEL
jgi:hypothetical protein